VTFYSAVTFTNALGLRVPLGFEQTLPFNWAMMCYNGLSIGFIIFVAGFGSRWSVRYTLMCVDGFAAIFWWFGWMSLYNAATNTINWVTPLNLIILAAILSAAIYLKEANKEASGASGNGGLTLINILYYFILLQTAIGLVNVTGIFTNNAAVTPTAYQYNNVNLQAQVTQQNNVGGYMQGLVSDASSLANMAIQSGQVILQIINDIAGYPGILSNAYPWMTQSPAGMAFILAIGVIVLLLDAWFVFLIFVKPPPIDNLNPG
jgi:hypothetical protein